MKTTEHGYPITALGLQAEAWSQSVESACEDCDDGPCEGCRAEGISLATLERGK